MAVWFRVALLVNLDGNHPHLCPCYVDSECFCYRWKLGSDTPIMATRLQYSLSLTPYSTDFSWYGDIFRSLLSWLCIISKEFLTVSRLFVVLVLVPDGIVNYSLFSILSNLKVVRVILSRGAAAICYHLKVFKKLETLKPQTETKYSNCFKHVNLRNWPLLMFTIF